MKMKTATVNLFAAAKKIETKPTTSGKDKLKIQIDGIESTLLAYEAAKAAEANAKTEKEMYAGRIKEIGREKWIKQMLLHKQRPESFQIVDGKGKVMVIIMDAYKKIEDAKLAALEEFPGIVETKTTYTINPELLEKYGQAISDALMKSKDISEEDKANIILASQTQAVKKGTIDRLIQYDNPEQLFYLIEPTVALK